VFPDFAIQFRLDILRTPSGMSIPLACFILSAMAGGLSPRYRVLSLDRLGKGAGLDSPEMRKDRGD
jgi:hypothetical protein